MKEFSQQMSNLGKFDSPQSLLKAYEALQSEFTKRCQLLSQTQKENEQLKQDANCKQRQEQVARQAMLDQNFVDNIVVKDQSIADKIIAKYLDDLSSGQGTSLLGATSGTAVLAPPKRPKNLSEAKRLVDIMLNS
ncbi:MAG: hypothetical protein FWD86_03415 [Firmicutes bacterium]|nr:hypothetical protein [Bacillota bacterium]